MNISFYVDFEKDVIETLNDFLLLIYNFESSLRAAEDLMLQSKTYIELVIDLGIVIDIIKEHSQEVQLFEESMEQFFLIIEDYANEVNKKNIKILDYYKLNDVYQSLRKLKSFIASLSGSNPYKIFDYSNYIDKFNLKKFDQAFIELYSSYYNIEKRLLDVLLMFN